MDILTILVYIGVSFALAFFIETMVEYVFGTPIDNIPQLEKIRPYKWALRYVAAAVGVYFSFYWKIDLVSIVANVIADIAKVQIDWAATPVGIIVSGLTIGRGSNYLHEFLSKHLKKPDYGIG
jgi:hypothetical protein